MSFAFSSISSLLASTGGLVVAPMTALTLLPLIAIGMNFYQYQSVDPEARPIDATQVCITIGLTVKNKITNNKYL